MPSKYTTPQGEEKGETAAIVNYFRKQEETMSQFSEQLKKLSASDKTELADGAAVELGWTKVP